MNRCSLYTLCVLLPFGTLLPTATAPAAEAPPAASRPSPKTDPRYPFRTGFANEHLPWYMPKALEFPPHHSDQRISGELVSADFIHRTGQFRMSKTGELVNFSMPPYGAINYLNAEADLRDIPLGTFFLFFLNQDSQGGFTRLATMQDQFTMDASHSFSYRLDEVKLTEGKLLTTKRSIPKKQDDLGKKEMIVTPETRVWRGAEQMKLEDLKPGDELLYNLTGKTATGPGWCTDIWVGADTHKLATEQQQAKFNAFTKIRGLPGWIDSTDANKIVITFFSGNSAKFKASYTDQFVVGKDVSLCVANEELRTWNPVVDKERASIKEVQRVPTDGYGCSGLRITVTVGSLNNMLEGFRKGRIVRVYGPGWTLKDQFYGESLMGYGFGRLQTPDLLENVAKDYPEQFPFRTDYSNEKLPWFQLKPGELPPPFAEHLVLGEIVKADAATRSGQFKADRTGALVDFTLIPEGSVKYLNADATLADLPPGTRCRFDLFQDEKGTFTNASLISDEFSHLAFNAITLRVEFIKPGSNDSEGEKKLQVSWQIPQVKNYNGDMERPPDIGRNELRVTKDTRVWKGTLDKPATLNDIAVGDALLVNVSADIAGTPGVCRDVWVGEETHKLVMEAQKAKVKALNSAAKVVQKK